jgi:small nuclear ribonucleoprotein (snRNP)-like protein
MDLYEYKALRKQERKANKPKVTFKERRKVSNEFMQSIWHKLLGATDTSYNAYQRMSTHTFLPKPNPREVDANEGAIAIYEAQRRFMQYKNPMHLPYSPVKHLDLTSAYATVLSGINRSLKYFMTYHFTDINKINNALDKNKFYIIDIKSKVSYDPLINLYAPNTKIKFNGRTVSDQNIPYLGGEVDVRFRLLQSEALNIFGFRYFLDDVYNQLIQIYDFEITIHAYDLKYRPSLIDYDDLRKLLDETKQIIDKEVRIDTKIAIVAFTGTLIHIDPGMRLIMLGRTEEIIHRFKRKLSELGAEIEGVQVDAIYYIGPDMSEKYMMHVINEVTGIDVYNYGMKSFVKVEDYTSKDYKETPFRLQEVHR